MQHDIKSKSRPHVKKDAKDSQKDEREEVKYSKKLKKSLLKIKTFLGVLNCSGLQEALIKLEKFCFIHCFKKRYIAVHVDKRKIEIFDPFGFTKTEQSSELIKFIKAHSTNRKLVFNNFSNFSCHSALTCKLFLVLRNLSTSFNKTVTNVNACTNKLISNR